MKRLILLNFFRAEAERRKIQENIPGIIYAIEEPETSQHTEHQRKLVSAFRSLSKTSNTQVILTTHSATLVKELEFQQIRLIKTNGNAKSIVNVLPSQLPYPSLNEVNFLAFSEITEEYHNELYGYLELEGELSNYVNGKPKMVYYKLHNNGSIKEEQKVLSEYIRHQIHHPENTNNTKYTFNQLSESINLMRNFIQDTLTS